MSRGGYPGSERRRFRRLALRYPVSIEAVSTSTRAPRVVADGVTVNLSFGGALVGLPDAAALHGAMPVRIRFVDDGRAVPLATSAVIWHRRDGASGSNVAVEFDAPLLAYEGAVEIADRLEWLEEMGGEDFLGGIVEGFLDSVPAEIQRARNSSKAGDLEAVAQITRSLKSSAGNIGATNLYEVARRAELAAREADQATAARFVNSLQDYFNAIRGELEGISQKRQVHVTRENHPDAD